MSALRFLVADDDDVDQERLRRLLAAIYPGCGVTEAHSGHSALALTGAENFDCVFIDFRLGDCIGTELVSKIRNHPGFSTPIVMVTGRGDERVAVDAMRVGVYDYLSKHNLTEPLLQATIESCLHKAHLQKSLNHANERLRLSMFDTLTGLANRDLFLDRLSQKISHAQRENEKFVILLADLNSFKEINDNFGHAMGDAVLAEIARRLQSAVRTSDTVARFGGDEFGLILSGISVPSLAIIIAEKIVGCVNELIILGDTVVSPGISLGLAVYPDDGAEAEVLLAHADAAMSRAKGSTLGYEFHSDLFATPTELLTRRVVASLGDAVENNELFLEYQPKISLSTGRVCGIEALVRWQSKDLGLLMPGAFIPLAERTSAIGPISYNVFELAFGQMNRWLQEKLNVPVAVNISARLLEDSGLVARLRELLKHYHIPPDMVTVELTETALAKNPEMARYVLRELSGLGVRISIDDFGVGYTSLRYLREFDIAEIKIDRLFVSGLSPGSRDEAIIRSVVALGKNFNVPTVAEGIELESCLTQLRALGCTQGQGYQICRPMAANKVPAWLAAWESDADTRRYGVN